MLRNKYFILIIVVFGFLLRLYSLNFMPYVIDESEVVLPISKTINFSPTDLNLPLGSTLTKHPLLSFYFVKIGTDLIGENKFGVRAPFLLLNLLGLLFIYLLVKNGLDSEKAKLALIFFSLSQYHIFLSVIATTQSLELFFVPLILYLFMRALRSNDKKYTFLFAIALGAGYLAKTTMVLLIPVFFIFMVSSRKHKDWFIWRKLHYVALIFFIIVFPNLYWNFTHEFINFKNSMQEIGRIGISLRAFALYLGELAPLFWDQETINRVCSIEYPFMHWVVGLFAFIGVVYSSRRGDYDLVRLLLITFLFIFGLSSFIEGPPGHLFLDSFWWAQISIVPALILASHMLINLQKRYVSIKYLTIVLIVYLMLHAANFVKLHQQHLSLLYN